MPRNSMLLNAVPLVIAFAWMAGGLTTMSVVGAEVFHVSQVWTGNGEILRDATIIVDDGKIVEVGLRGNVSIPDGAIVHELGDSIIVPGLVLAETTLSERGRDEEEAITPYIQAIDGFDYFADYDDYLSVGITTIQISPGSERLMPGQGAVVKLAGDDIAEQTLAERDSLRILLTQAAFNPPRLYEPPVGAVSVERPVEPTRPQLAGNLADAIAGLRALFTACETPSSSDDIVLSAIVDAIKSGRPVRITAKSAGEINAAMQLVESFQLPYLLVDAEQMASLSASLSLSVDLMKGIVLKTGDNPAGLGSVDIPNPDQPKLPEAWERVRFVLDSGAIEKLAITTADSNLQQIWFLAADLLAAGIDKQTLLSCLTSNAARILGVDQRVGTIAAGKDADFLVLSGEPFGIKTQVLWTYVNGRPVFERAANDNVKVVTADSIYTGDAVLQHAAITVAGSRIGSVGTDVSYPIDAELIQFPGCVIVPGFVDMGTRVGTGTNFGDRVGLNEKIGDLLVSDDDSVGLARQGGVTTGLLYSTSLPSPVMAFKLGDRPRVLADPVALRFKIEGNLTSEESKWNSTLDGAKKYAESWNEYDKAYEKYKVELAEYEKAKAKYDAELAARKKKEEEEKKEKEKDAADKSESTEKPAGEVKDSSGSPASDKPVESEQAKSSEASEKPAVADDKPQEKEEENKAEASATELTEPKKPEEPKKPRENVGLEPYRALFGGEIPAIVEVGDAKGLELAVKLFVDKYELRTVLAAEGSSFREAEKLRGKKVAALVHPPFEVSEDGESVNLAESFIRAGVSTAIETRAGTGTKRLPTAISFAIHRGLGRDDALRCLTVTPAELVGLKSVGKLAPSRDADLVVLSGKPFEPGSRVVAVMIDGQWVYRSESKPKIVENGK